MLLTERDKRRASRCNRLILSTASAAHLIPVSFTVYLVLISGDRPVLAGFTKKVSLQ